MSVKFHDFDTEQYVLAACLQGPDLWTNFPDAWLREDISIRAYKEFKKFLEPPYSTFPTGEIVAEKCPDADVKMFVKELQRIKVDKSELNVKRYDLFSMFASRRVIDIAGSIPNDIEKNRVEDLIRDKISLLTDLVNPFTAGQRKRNFIHEGAPERWKRYKEMEADPSRLPGTPYHVTELDNLTNGGIRKGHIICFFARSGGFKTLLKMNLAYNLAFLENKRVMVITLEVPMEDYQSLVDSRHSLLDYDNITRGMLSSADKDRFRKSLIEIKEKKPNLYLVDIPDRATSADIIGEMELYYVKFGAYPEVIVVDYINELEPAGSWDNVGQKFKDLGVELRRISRMYEVANICSLQMTRKGQQKKHGEEVDTEDMGETHYFQNVCHLVGHLWQDTSGVDEAESMLNVSIKKNRYGPKESFKLFVFPKLKYIGDMHVSHLVK